MAGVPSDLLSFLLEPVRDEMVRRVKLVAGATAGAKALRQKLKQMKSQLADADRKLLQNKSQWNWMAQMTDLEFRAEDAIEEHQVGSNIGTDRAEKIQKLLECISEKMTAEGIDQSSGAIASNNQDEYYNKTSSDFDEEDCFVGKESELNQLVSLLIDEKYNRVISLWGMAGIGKTAMAREVFHHMMNDVDNHFQAFVWVCVTRQFEPRSVLEDVLIKLIEAEAEVSKEEQILKVSHLSDDDLIVELRKKQKAKRCLIVLDDVWEVCDWDKLKRAFIDRGSLSRVLITTRELEVARIGLTVEVELLTPEAGWELLKKKTFFKHEIPANFSREDHDVIKIGEVLVEKCGRLPLAISVLGGVLRHKEISLREWELVAKDMKAYIDKHGETVNKLDAALTLSYNALPYHLKLCFLYLGILGEGQSIHVGVLYHMWIAQGMILDENSRVHGASLMAVAEQHLSDLASRSLVQVEHDDGVSTKKFMTCKLHDWVRGLCLELGKKVDNLVQFVEYKSGSFSDCLQRALRIRTRHLVIHCRKEPEGDGELTFRSGDEIEEDNCESLRSLHIHNVMAGETMCVFPRKLDIRRFRSLRSLVFQRFKFKKTNVARKIIGHDELVDRITNLVHLKHLCFRSCEIVGGLPSSIQNLVFLVTLDLYKSLNIKIPSDLEKMPPGLKHLLLPRCTNRSKSKLKLDKLKHLESLMGFNSSVHEFSDAKDRMKDLERFSARMHDNDSLSTILAAIDQKENKLVNSIVVVEDGCIMTPTELVKAFTCQNLPSLGIYVPLRGLLTECRDSIVTSNIACLELSKCEIEEDVMEILGDLPHLTELTLNMRSFVGEEMTCHESSFSRLKILMLFGLPKFSKWGVVQGAMKVLSELHIRDCRGLKLVPVGLCGISTLRKLVMIGMPAFRLGVLEVREKFNKHCQFISNIPPNRSVQVQAQRFSQPQEEIAEPTQFSETLDEPQEEIVEPTQFYENLDEKTC